MTFAVISMSIFFCLGFVACGGGDDVTEYNYYYKYDLSNSGGSLMAINMATNDSIVVDDSNGKLKARNGDVIKMTFVPKEEYEDYEFNVKYILLNDSIIEKSGGEGYVYEYILKDIKVGEYKIEMLATSIGTNKKENLHDSHRVTANQSFTLVVSE